MKIRPSRLPRPRPVAAAIATLAAGASLLLPTAPASSVTA
jgi:hypothetical protein